MILRGTGVLGVLIMGLDRTRTSARVVAASRGRTPTTRGCANGTCHSSSAHANDRSELFPMTARSAPGLFGHFRRAAGAPRIDVGRGGLVYFCSRDRRGVRVAPASTNRSAVCLILSRCHHLITSAAPVGLNTRSFVGTKNDIIGHPTLTFPTWQVCVLHQVCQYCRTRVGCVGRGSRS